VYIHPFCLHTGLFCLLFGLFCVYEGLILDTFCGLHDCVAERLQSRRKRAACFHKMFRHTRPIDTLTRPLCTQKRAIHAQKRLTYTQKSHVCRVFTREIRIQTQKPYIFQNPREEGSRRQCLSQKADWNIRKSDLCICKWALHIRKRVVCIHKSIREKVCVHI